MKPPWTIVSFQKIVEGGPSLAMSIIQRPAPENYAAAAPWGSVPRLEIGFGGYAELVELGDKGTGRNPQYPGGPARTADPAPRVFEDMTDV